MKKFFFVFGLYSLSFSNACSPDIPRTVVEIKEFDRPRFSYDREAAEICVDGNEDAATAIVESRLGEFRERRRMGKCLLLELGEYIVSCPEMPGLTGTPPAVDINVHSGHQYLVTCFYTGGTVGTTEVQPAD